MRRFISVWLPCWATDRWRTQQSEPHRNHPLVLIARIGSSLRLTAVDKAAGTAGLVPGMTLADARALLPELVAGDSDPEADTVALDRLCRWCSRFSPWVAIDGTDGLILDVSGVPHLFGGELPMLDQLQTRFSAMHLDVRPAMADTPAAAWAWARFGQNVGQVSILPAGSGLERLGALPSAALRLAPDTLADLNRLGLATIAAIAAQPRGPLARRLGLEVIARLDALLGHCAEPISPQQQPAPWRARADLPEPILTRSSIETILRHLLETLCDLLNQEQRGARRLLLHAYRVDGDVQSLAIGTSLPCRDPQHLFHLYREPLDTIVPGFGIETLLLEAPHTEPMTGLQIVLPEGGERTGRLAELIDHLQMRLGSAAIHRQQCVESHWPENAIRRVTPLRSQQPDVMPASDRPIHLLSRPESIEVETGASGWPIAFRRHRMLRQLIRLDGPERVSTEWWLGDIDAPYRDYYRAEDNAGTRYWLFRQAGAWYLHGLFP